MTNALEAMNNCGEIWLKIDSRNNNLIVGNSNSYIPESKLNSIFDSFYTDGKDSGTGLGLKIVKEIVESHGGQIKCKSVKGIKTEFIINLPETNFFVISNIF